MDTLQEGCCDCMYIFNQKPVRRTHIWKMNAIYGFLCIMYFILTYHFIQKYIVVERKESQTPLSDYCLFYSFNGENENFVLQPGDTFAEFGLSFYNSAENYTAQLSTFGGDLLPALLTCVNFRGNKFVGTNCNIDESTSQNFTWFFITNVPGSYDYSEDEIVSFPIALSSDMVYMNLLMQYQAELQQQFYLFWQQGFKSAIYTTGCDLFCYVDETYLSTTAGELCILMEFYYQDCVDLFGFIEQDLQYLSKRIRTKYQSEKLLYICDINVIESEAAFVLRCFSYTGVIFFVTKYIFQITYNRMYRKKIKKDLQHERSSRALKEGIQVELQKL